MGKLGRLLHISARLCRILVKPEPSTHQEKVVPGTDWAQLQSVQMLALSAADYRSPPEVVHVLCVIPRESHVCTDCLCSNAVWLNTAYASLASGNNCAFMHAGETVLLLAPHVQNSCVRCQKWSLPCENSQVSDYQLSELCCMAPLAWNL